MLEVDLEVPTVHLNGTAKADLVGKYVAALDALRDAIAGLEGCAPNERDYYVRGRAAYTRASRQHRARVQKILEVALDVEAICEVVAQGEGG